LGIKIELIGKWKVETPLRIKGPKEMALNGRKYKKVGFLEPTPDKCLMVNWEEPWKNQ